MSSLHAQAAGIFAVCAAFIVSACTQAGIRAANFPVRFSDVQIEKNIAFGTGGTDRLDIYRPPQDGPHPVIVFFYGGRWTEGRKEDYAFAGNELAEQGFVTVIPDYRKYPDVKFPAFVTDAAQAVAWTAQNIGKYGGDTEKIFTAGHSSGAHIGALLTADERYLAAAGAPPETIKGFAGLSGPYDFEPKAKDLKDMFGPPENYPQMQVSTFIDGTEPPVLLLYGAEDTLVGIENLEKLRAAIEKADGRVQAKIYPGINHVEIIGALSWLWRHKAPVSEDLKTFFTGIQP